MRCPEGVSLLFSYFRLVALIVKIVPVTEEAKMPNTLW